MKRKIIKSLANFSTKTNNYKVKKEHPNLKIKMEDNICVLLIFWLKEFRQSFIVMNYYIII